VVIVFVNMAGPILYFLVGRDDRPVEPTAPGPGAMPGWGSPHDPPIAPPPTGSPAPRPSAVSAVSPGPASAVAELATVAARGLPATLVAAAFHRRQRYPAVLAGPLSRSPSPSCLT
jgi:hypothetical protein